MATLTRAELLAAVRQSVTLVGPGDVLAVRVAADTTDSEMAFLGDRAACLLEETGARVLFFRAEEFAVVAAEGAPPAAVAGETIRGLQRHARVHGGNGPGPVQRALGGAR
jgi:hypothetical protein